MVELADTLDLGSSAERCRGSTPLARTNERGCGGMVDAGALKALAERRVGSSPTVRTYRGASDSVRERLLRRQPSSSMSTGARVHARVGGLKAEDISQWNGLR